MATIEHLQGDEREDVIAKAQALYTDMHPVILQMQDVLLRGAADVLRVLLERGCTPENAQLLLNDIMLSSGMVHGTAIKRGIKLMDFLPPNTRAH